MSLGALSYLENFRQFVVVMLVPLATGKTNKLPVHWRTGQVCDSQDPANWCSYAEASAAAKRGGAEMFRIGFVLTEADDLVCLDIDNCAEPGGWSALSQSLCAHLPGAVIEVSQSGRGLHLWMRRSSMPMHSSKDVARGLELYSARRFIALGGIAMGEMAEDCTAIDAVVSTFFPPREKVSAVGEGGGPRPEWRGPTEDADLIRRAVMSKSAGSVFGGKASFADLWHADEKALSKAYPSDASSSEPYDRSSADAALAQHLAFWCGCDTDRIDRLMRASGLARDKYEDRGDYLPRTIANACSMQRDVLQDKPSAVDQALAAEPALPEPGPGAPVAGMVAVEGSTFLSPAEQVKLFAGCTYVVDAHRALVPGGYMLKPDQFRAKYGGYSFSMDARNEKTTRNAWEAFTESQVLRRPIADGTCFRPDLPFGTIVTDAGRRRANLYWPIEVDSIEGDTGPFDRHLALLFPDPRDQLIALCGMAAIVQYPGRKFQWALMFQGVEGNGKTFLSRCVAEAVGRRYTYWPAAKKIAANFNAWLYGHIFFAVEDIHTSADSDILDQIKPMITGGDGLEIEAKGVDQTTREICGNFIFNSNHKNAIKKTRNDRRFCMLFCAQQSVDDLTRDGMDDNYMVRLYDWARSGGFARVTHKLKNFAIPDEFNPATKCQRAPVTTSTAAAIEQSLGSAEQEIVEAIDAGHLGFRGGWVSSLQLDILLERIGKARSVSINRRRDMMRSIGYDWHPGLVNGRVNNLILPDNGKPRLYVKAGHAALALTAPADIARAYTAAQASA